MRESGAKAPKVGWIDAQLWVEEWRRLHPVKPVHCVAGRLDAPARTVEKWFAGAAPSLAWFGAILAAYGPGFVLAGMRNPPAWLNDAARREKRERLMQAQAQLEAEIAALVSGDDAP